MTNSVDALSQDWEQTFSSNEEESNETGMADQEP